MTPKAYMSVAVVARSYRHYSGAAYALDHEYFRVSAAVDASA